MAAVWAALRRALRHHCAPATAFIFAGIALEVESIKDLELYVRAAKKASSIPSYMGARMPLTTHLSERVRAFLTDRAGWARFPDDVREWLEMQDHRSAMPEPGQLLAETFPHEGRHYLVVYPFEGWNAHQSLGNAGDQTNGDPRAETDGFCRQ